jgi:hypothetical protein
VVHRMVLEQDFLWAFWFSPVSYALSVVLVCIRDKYNRPRWSHSMQGLCLTLPPQLTAFWFSYRHPILCSEIREVFVWNPRFMVRSWKLTAVFF